MARQFADTPQVMGSAGLLRRLLAMVYDGLICIALLMVVTGIYNSAYKAVVGAERYKQLFESGATVAGKDPLLASVLFISLYLFFAYFWTRNGQTLGMQVWHIRVQNRNNTSISWLQALLRFLMGWISWAALGLGYLWMLFDRSKRTWTDRFSESVTVRIAKPYGKEASKQSSG